MGELYEMTFEGNVVDTGTMADNPDFNHLSRFVDMVNDSEIAAPNPPQSLEWRRQRLAVLLGLGFQPVNRP